MDRLVMQLKMWFLIIMRYLWSSQRQFRVTRPGTTETAKKTFPELRFKQVDQITISTSAIPASWPHMDFDFSQILWTVYGSRLLCDFGYGYNF